MNIKTRRRLHLKYDLNKPSFYKAIKKFALKCTDYLKGKDYLVYSISIYDTTTETENGSKNAYTTKFVLPKCWCYGPVDIFEYSYQYDAAVARSKVAPTAKNSDVLTSDKIQFATMMV